VSATLTLVTCPTAAVGRRLGAALVRERLAACVNVVPGLTSIYRWKGKVETAREVLLLVKSTAARAKRLASRVKELHPYETPEVLTLRIASGDAAYLRWLGDSVR
jgi:periplasmic divalent cation tolerance protein